MPCENCSCGQDQEETTPTLRERVTRFLTPYQYPPAPSRRLKPEIRGSVPQGKLFLNDSLAPLSDIVERADAEYPARPPAFPDGRE